MDNAGTAHIVWNQDGGDSPDQLRYCRLKRGATACDNPPASIAPDQPGPFNSPAFNDDIAGPRILTIADGLIFLTHRYPNIVPKPDGTETDRTTYLYTSTDGGQTITGPAIVGDGEPSGGAATFGDGSRIGLISDTRTGGTFFQAIDPGRTPARKRTSAATGPTAPTRAAWPRSAARRSRRTRTCPGRRTSASFRRKHRRPWQLGRGRDERGGTEARLRAGRSVPGELSALPRQHPGTAPERGPDCRQRRHDQDGPLRCP